MLVVWTTTIISFFPVNCFPHGPTAASDQGLRIIEASRSHSDTPHSVGLLWTSDQPVAETSTWQYTKITTGKHPYHRRDLNPHSQQANSCRPLPWTAWPLGSDVLIEIKNIIERKEYSQRSLGFVILAVLSKCGLYLIRLLYFVMFFDSFVCVRVCVCVFCVFGLFGAALCIANIASMSDACMWTWTITTLHSSEVEWLPKEMLAV
jgi:hypothetical protein